MDSDGLEIALNSGVILLLLLGHASSDFGSYRAEEDVATRELAMRWQLSEQHHGDVYETVGANHSSPQRHANARVLRSRDDVTHLGPDSRRVTPAPAAVPYSGA